TPPGSVDVTIDRLTRAPPLTRDGRLVVRGPRPSVFRRPHRRQPLFGWNPIRSQPDIRQVRIFRVMFRPRREVGHLAPPTAPTLAGPAGLAPRSTRHTRRPTRDTPRRPTPQRDHTFAQLLAGHPPAQPPRPRGGDPVPAHPPPAP